MGTRSEFIEYLKSEFPEGVIVSGGNEFVCRCRICGDSQSNQYKKRFYISLNDPSGLIFYHCFNCGASGVLTAKILKKLCNPSTDMLLYLNTNNKEFRDIHHKSKTIYKLYYEDIIDDEFNRVKLKYLNTRLGLSLTYKDYIANKIVFSINSIIKKNNLDLTRKEDIVKDLDLHYIGALSLNNSVCYMRLASTERKHVKYILHPSDDIKKYYTVPTTNDMNKFIRINIAEGMFDILSVFYNLRNANRYNEIYIASGSQGYSSVMKMLLIEYGFINYEFHLYIDNDVSDRLINKIKETYKYFHMPIYIHRNFYKNEKDFGVPLNRIDDTVQTLVRGY